MKRYLIGNFWKLPLLVFGQDNKTYSTLPVITIVLLHEEAFAEILYEPTISLCRKGDIKINFSPILLAGQRSLWIAPYNSDSSCPPAYCVRFFLRRTWSVRHTIPQGLGNFWFPLKEVLGSAVLCSKLMFARVPSSYIVSSSQISWTIFTWNVILKSKASNIKLSTRLLL